MSGTIPPAPPTLPNPVPAGGGQAVVTVAVAGPKVAEGLQAGAMLDAAITARAPRGAVEVQLPTGTLTLKLPPDMAALPNGSRLALLLLPQDANGLPQFRLMGVNGRMLLPNGLPQMPGSGGASQLLAGAPPSPAAMAPLPTAGSMPQPGGMLAGAGILAAPAIPAIPLGITATMLRPAVTPGTQMPGAPMVPGGAGLPLDLAPGSTVTVRIVGTAPPGVPGPGVSPQPAATPSPAVPPQVPAPTASSPTPAAPPAAGPQPAVQPAARAPAALPQAAPPPPLLTVTVTAHPPGGQAVVQTPIGALAVPSRVDLPVGSRMVLEVVGRPEPPPASPPPNVKPDGLSQGGWPALADATQSLARTDAQVAEQFLRVLPQANHRLAASMAMFAGALRSGDARQILSDAVTRGLEKAGKRDVSEKLKGDIDKLSADSTRSLGGGEWRAYTMPFLNGAEIEPIRLFVRHVASDEEKRKSGGKADGQRFILEVTMRQIGRIQLDGMVRRDDKSFDLIMRTDAALPADMRRDILGIFADNCEVCGTKGMVVFQTGRFVDLPPDTNPTALMV